MKLGHVGQLSANFPFQAGNDKPLQRIASAGSQELGMWVPGRHQHLLGLTIHGVKIGFDLDSQGFGPFAPVDRQHAMRRHTAQRLVVAEIILKWAFSLALRLFFLVFLFLLAAVRPRGDFGRRR